MRICHIIESASGGSAAILASLAEHFIQRGHQVHVIYSPDRADDALIACLKDSGCASVNAASMRRSVGLHDAADGLRLRKLLRSIGPVDIVHSHSSKAGALARAFGSFKDTAQIYSPHGFFTMTGHAPAYVGPVERILSWVTDRIIAVSEFEKQHAQQIGIAEERVSVVANGIAPFDPMTRDSARQELGVDPSAFIIGFVGRLTAQKDPVAAIEAVARLPQHVAAQVVLIGEGDELAAAETRAAELGPNVIFAGARDAKPLLSAFDCLLCTSRYEGMPVSFLEALNCGVPIISYPVGGTEELILEGKTGFVTAAEPSAAAEAIANLAAKLASERREISDACKALASIHTAEVMANATLEVYKEVLEKRQTG